MTPDCLAKETKMGDINPDKEMFYEFKRHRKYCFVKDSQWALKTYMFLFTLQNTLYMRCSVPYWKEVFLVSRGKSF